VTEAAGRADYEASTDASDARGVWPGYAAWADTVVECRREFVAVARRFWLLPEIIPPLARDDVALLYSLCRRIDDAVDEAADAQRAHLELGRWRDELRGRAPARPLVAAFLAGAARSALPLECVESLLDGMESDLGPVRIADDDALLRYAYRVSASVGLLLAPLLGVHGAEAERRVVDLGLALQLSNVLLGVRGDARRDRVYLPAARLAAAGLSPDDVVRDPDDPRLLPVMRGLAALADRHYRSAALGASLVPLRYRHGGLLLGRAYRDLGWRAARGEATPESPARLSPLAKVVRLAELLLIACDPRTIGLFAPPPHDPALHRAISGWRGAHDAHAGDRAERVVTTMSFAAPPAQLWKRLVFYEEIDARPPLHVRLMLPAPVATVGSKSRVGDEAKCLYDGGHLIKRVTRLDPCVEYRFEIAEQALEVGGGIRLLGGSYSFRELPGGGTEIALTTRYHAGRRPRWLWRRIEAAVCHAFHRHILASMRAEAP
jgi:phytoene synthase